MIYARAWKFRIKTSARIENQVRRLTARVNVEFEYLFMNVNNIFILETFWEYYCRII